MLEVIIIGDSDYSPGATKGQAKTQGQAGKANDLVPLQIDIFSIFHCLLSKKKRKMNFFQ